MVSFFWRPWFFFEFNDETIRRNASHILVGKTEQTGSEKHPKQEQQGEERDQKTLGRKSQHS